MLRQREISFWAAVFALIAIIGLGVAFEVSVWRECRADHSWLYCIRVLG